MRAGVFAPSPVCLVTLGAKNPPSLGGSTLRKEGLGRGELRALSRS